MGTSTSYVQQTNSNLPSYAEPYYRDLMQRAEAGLTRGYQPYQDANGKPIERIAGFTDQQKQIQNNILNQQTPGQFGQASGLAGMAGLGALTAGSRYAQQGGPGSFTNAGTAQQYMSPYIQQVLDVQKQQAIRDAQQGQLAQNLGAARQGTYGGARQLLASTERERNLGNQLGNIEATGLQSAYDTAMRQFNAEDAARMQNQQYGADLGLRGYGLADQAGQTLGNIGSMQSQADMARLNQQQGTAAQEQALQQERMTQQYQDFQNQRDYYNQQLQQYSSLLHGVPIQNNTTTTTSAPTPSLASQLVGTGLSALGTYKTLAG